MKQTNKKIVTSIFTTIQKERKKERRRAICIGLILIHSPHETQTKKLTEPEKEKKMKKKRRRKDR